MQSTVSTAACVLAACASCATAARAAEEIYPARVIRIVVPLAAGGNADIIARIVGQCLAESLHQSVVIDNRPGANSMIASELVARAVPDGYTLLAISSTHAVNPSLVTKLPYDSIKDFAAVGLVAATSNLVAAHPSVPVNSIKDLIAFARTHPGKLNYGSSGSGSPGNLGGALLASMAGIDIVHVAYKGTAQAAIDVIAGQIELGFISITSSLSHVKSGKLKALAITGAQRSAIAPELPTVAEAGVPGYQAATWNGLVAPAATPKPIVARLNQAIVQQLNTQDIKARYASLGADLLYGSPAEFEAFLRAETEKWARVIKDAKIKVDLVN